MITDRIARKFRKIESGLRKVYQIAEKYGPIRLIFFWQRKKGA